MTEAKRGWDLLSDDKRKEAIESIIDFFKTERDEEIGIIAAEDVLDMLMQNIGRQIYNKGIEDAKKVLHSRFEDMTTDLESLARK